MGFTNIWLVGFDIDTPDDFGRTCLHAAAAGGYVKSIHAFIFGVFFFSIADCSCSFFIIIIFSSLCFSYAFPLELCKHENNFKMDSIYKQ